MPPPSDDPEPTTTTTDAPEQPNSRTVSLARRKRPGQHYSAAERDDLMPKVLHIFSICGTESEACRATGVARSTIWEWRQKFPAFEAAYQEAQLDAFDVLEGAAILRGAVGVDRERPIYYQGELVGTERWKDYDARLLLALLGARAPDRYGRTTHELTGPKGAPIQLERVNDDSADNLALIAGILSDAGALRAPAIRDDADAEDDEIHPDEEA